MERKLKGEGLIREGAPPKIRALLDTYGDQKIVGLQVGRFPIYSAIEKLANIITLGQWEENKAKLKYDKMFHLFLLITLEGGHRFRLERNETVHVKPIPEQIEGEDRTNVKVFGHNIKLRPFIDKAEAQAKPRNLWRYDAIDNNCQCFVRDCLKGSNIWTANLNAFVMQDAYKLIEGFEWFKDLAKTVTDAAAVVDHVQEGEGKTKTPVLDSVKKKYKL